MVEGLRGLGQMSSLLEPSLNSEIVSRELPPSWILALVGVIQLASQVLQWGCICVGLWDNIFRAIDHCILTLEDGRTHDLPELCLPQ